MKRFCSWQQAAPLLVLAFFSAAVTYGYFHAFLGNFFVFDDFRYIENIYHGPQKVMLGYNAFRVVSNFAWYPLFALFGFEPSGYTLVSLLLYALNPLLLYLLVLKLSDRKELALLTAAFFVANGVVCDVVFWKMSLSTLLCTALYFTTLWLYLDYRQRGERWRLAAAIGVYLLAMFTKEDAASLPFVVVLLEWLFFAGQRRPLATIGRSLPFAAVILCYLGSSSLVFHFLQVQSETAKFFKFRPLYSLLAGYSAFFLPPEGRVELGQWLLYLPLLLIPASFLVLRQRQLLGFALLWIPCTFLPQSLSAIGRFDPVYLFNSLSRLLYLPTVGAALVAALVLVELQERFSRRVMVVVACAVLLTLVAWHYPRVQARGQQWYWEAEEMSRFLPALKQALPSLPLQTFVYVLDAPTGRAYMQQALRAYYGNPGITWLVDPAAFHPQPGQLGLFIQTIRLPGGGFTFQFSRID